MDRRSLASFTTMLVILLLGLLVVASCGRGQEETVAPTSEPEQVVPPTLDGQSLVEERCTTCHGLERTARANKTEEEWRATVERMVSRGANLGSAEQEAVVQYLAETYSR
jgi:mono/diheme cytochrome c family protein